MRKKSAAVDRGEGSPAATIAAMVARGDLDEAVRATLASWRARPIPAAAEALERVTALALERFEAPRPGARFHAEWMSLARTRDDATTTGYLAHTLSKGLVVSSSTPNRNWRGEVTGRSRDIDHDASEKRLADRLAALAPRLPDPRIAAALFDLLERLPLGGKGARRVPVYAEVLRALVAARDVRQIARLEALLEIHYARRASPRAVTAARAKQRAEQDWLVVGGRRACAELSKLGPAAGGDDARLADVAPPPDTSNAEGTERSLCEAVLAALDDDEPRLVLADYLSASGDPRGEAIRLQLRKAAADREKGNTILKRNKALSLGPALASVLVSLAFRRGFVDTAELVTPATVPPDVWEAALDDPRLGTLVELRRGKGSAAIFGRFLASRRMLSLTTATVFLVSELEPLLAADSPRALRHLDLSIRVNPEDACRRIANAPAFENLVSVALHWDCSAAEARDILARTGLAARMKKNGSGRAGKRTSRSESTAHV